MSEMVGSATREPEDPAVLAKRRRFLWRMILVLVGGTFLDGYILGIIGPVTGTIEHDDPRYTAIWIGLEASSAMLGILIGSPVGGWLADRLGRRPILFWDLVLFTAFSALQFFVDGPWQLFLVRLGMGIAVGVEYAVGQPMIAEFAPVHLRGKLLGTTLVAWYFGFMVAFIIGYYLNAAGVHWRVILGSSTIIAVILVIGRIGLPESPRWLWSRGRTEEAHEIALEYMDTAYQTDMAKAASDGVVGSFGMLFSPAVWRSTVFMCVFWTCAVAPYFAIATFADNVMGTVGLTGLLSGVILSVFAWLGVTWTTLVIDRYSRRSLCVPTQWAAAVLLVVIGLWAGAPAPIMLVMFLAYSFLNAVYTCLTMIYPAEIFPTEIRALGTGFSAAVSRLGAAGGLFLIPLSLDHLGFTWTMIFAAIVAFVGALVSQILAPETGGKSLSELASEVTH